MGVFLPDSLLTSIVAQAPYLGTPLGGKWGGEDASTTPVFSAFLDCFSDQKGLLSFGNTGWLGGNPFIHRDFRVQAAKVAAPRPDAEPPIDLEGRIVKQLRDALGDNN